MKLATVKKRSELFRAYSREELQRMFRNRSADELFASVGAMEMSITTQRHAPPHILAWTGYELLMGIDQLNKKTELKNETT